jgi:hypothetical protein
MSETNREIHVFECIDKDDQMGEKWETIEYNYVTDSIQLDQEGTQWGIRLNKDKTKNVFRMPTYGFLHIPHPNIDDQHKRIYYQLPVCAKESDYKNMPDFVTINLTSNMYIRCKKDIIDYIEKSDSSFYIYRPAMLCISRVE